MTPFRTLRAVDRNVMPWKNGRGWTSEIAIEPRGSTLETFDWRISIAGTESDGPFSVFPGVDRTLALLTGRIVLTIEGRPPTEMRADSPPVVFPGDVPTSATLIAGPLTDFNVMTRRERFIHHVLRQRLDQAIDLPLHAEVTLLMSRHEGLHVSLGSQSEVLSTNDVALFGRTDGVTNLAPSTPGEIFLIQIEFRK